MAMELFYKVGRVCGMGNVVCVCVLEGIGNKDEGAETSLYEKGEWRDAKQGWIFFSIVFYFCF